MTNDQLNPLTSNDKHFLSCAIERITKGLSYGDDMRSSAQGCINDAIHLLLRVRQQMESSKNIF